MLNEALSFWEAISGKVKQLIRGETKNVFRTERYEVTTAPDGTKIGVKLPFGTNEIFLPYSSELATATVGESVLVVWWGSMSNAKAYYYADGYRGGLAAYPIGSIYMSVNSTSPATLFGGTWVQIKDTFLLSAGDTYSAGDTGGEAEHKLTVAEMPKHKHQWRGFWTVNKGASGTSTQNKSRYWQSDEPLEDITNEIGGDAAHNNMPPYLTVYMWKRTA